MKNISILSGDRLGLVNLDKIIAAIVCFPAIVQAGRYPLTKCKCTALTTLLDIYDINPNSITTMPDETKTRVIHYLFDFYFLFKIHIILIFF